MRGISKVVKFGECAKRFIPNLDEDGLEYDLLKYDIDDQGPICSDSVLLSAFRDNIDPPILENDLYAIIEKVCMEYAMEMRSLNQ
jgi:hypothetical protein